MKRLRNQKFVAIILALVLVLSSCSIGKKNKERRLIGAWNVVNVIDPTSEITEQWIFEANGRIIRLEITDSSNTIIDEGDWALEQKINTAYCDVVFGTEASELAGLSVLWEILYLKKNTMVFTHQEGGLLTKEFEKVN